MTQERGAGSSPRRGSRRRVVDKSAGDMAEAIRAEYAQLLDFWAATPFRQESRVADLTRTGMAIVEGVRYRMDHQAGCARAASALQSHREKYTGTAAGYRRPLIEELKQTYLPLLQADPPMMDASVSDFLIYLNRIVSDWTRIDSHLNMLNTYINANWLED